MERTGRAAAAEFIATFALVFVGTGAVIMHVAGELDLTGVALANGLVLAVFITVTLPLSGGMVNPAVAVGLWTTGRIPTRRGAILIVAEFAGALAGAWLLKLVLPSELFDHGRGGLPMVAPGITAGKGILIEAAGTFFWVFAVFGTVVDDRGGWSKPAGLIVGLVLAFDIMAFGPLTGAAVNPARWFASAVATNDFTNWYVWIIGPVAGAIIASVVYWFAFLRDRQPVTP